MLASASCSAEEAGLLDRQAETLGDRLEGVLRGVGVELHAPTEEGRRPDGAHDDMRVGRGRLGAALAIAGRTGIGAGALRADA